MGLARAWFGGILVESEVGPGSVIVLDVLPQDAPQVLLSENDHMVEAFPPERFNGCCLHQTDRSKYHGFSTNDEKARGAPLR